MQFLKNGNICSPKDFYASAVACGLKKSGKKDLCIICSTKPAIAAAAFTSNKFCAAPVEISKEKIKNSKYFRAIVVNSGNANACTGSLGLQNARKMAAYAAKCLALKDSEVLVCSTGRIGVQLPMRKIRSGIKNASKSISPEKGSEAAEAIMTTDLVKKECAVSFSSQKGEKITIASMTKGSGMISPQMHSYPHATMLCFITTDAAVERAFLRKTFSDSIESTFNKISVDNDMSTNDTVIMLANGSAGNDKIRENSPDAANFAKTLRTLMEKMAKSIVLDGEGATKFVTVVVENASTRSDAEKCARAICNSMLCKTAWFGGDPNWGRIVAAAGYSEAKFNPQNIDLFYNNKPVIRRGKPSTIKEEILAKEVSKKEFIVRIRLGAGSESCTMWTSDLSYDYVKINADYRT